MKHVQIVGAGCPQCRKLAENVRAAADSLGVELRIDVVSEIVEILKFDISATPALVVDGQIKLVGEVPSVEDLRQLLLPQA